MKKTNSTNGLRSEYDFASMKGGIRSKYAKRYREGTNIVLLEPEIADQALHGVPNTTRALRGTGGLAKKTLQSAGQRGRHRSKRR